MNKSQHIYLTHKLFNTIKNIYDNNESYCEIEVPESFTTNSNNNNNIKDLLMYKSYKNEFNGDIDCNIDIIDKKYIIPRKYINEIFQTVILKGENKYIGNNKLDLYISMLANIYAYFVLVDKVALKSFEKNKLNNDESNNSGILYNIMEKINSNEMNFILTEFQYDFNNYSIEIMNKFKTANLDKYYFNKNIKSCLKYSFMLHHILVVFNLYGNILKKLIAKSPQNPYKYHPLEESYYDE